MRYSITDIKQQTKSDMEILFKYQIVSDRVAGNHLTVFEMRTDEVKNKALGLLNRILKNMKQRGAISCFTGSPELIAATGTEAEYILNKYPDARALVSEDYYSVVVMI